MFCFNSSNLLMYYFADKDLLIMHWLQAPDDCEYRDALQLMLQIGREKRIKNWLVNSQNLGQLSIDNANWMYENWYPHFLQLPTEKYACIAADDVYYLLVLEDMFHYQKKIIQFDFQFFSDMNSALEWVREEIPIETKLGVPPWVFA